MAVMLSAAKLPCILSHRHPRNAEILASALSKITPYASEGAGVNGLSSTVYPSLRNVRTRVWTR